VVLLPVFVGLLGQALRHLQVPFGFMLDVAAVSLAEWSAMPSARPPNLLAERLAMGTFSINPTTALVCARVRVGDCAAGGWL
jgi:hypothetical protein